MLSFSIPRITADRLARLGLACADETGALGHIGVRVTATAIRFSATNGRILASLLVPCDAVVGDLTDLVLDQVQFAAAIKAAAKAPGGRISVTVNDTEARLSNGPVAAVVRRIEGTYPQVDHVWSRPDGRRWVPTMSSLDPHLVAVAQKLSGSKQALLFSSPVDPGMRLERLWSVPGAMPDEAISINDLRAVVSAPAYWSDHELAILVMPITRSADERAMHLSDHALPLTAAVARAA
jgi:hypothetical protein